MGPVYDKPRAELTQGGGRREPPLPDHGGRRPDPVDPGLRLRAGARLAPEHARLDDQQEALLGPGAADLRLPGVRDVRRRRRPRGARASGRSRAGSAFEGHTPHRPYVDAVTIACSSCGEPVERIADVGNPWLDAGIVPFSTLHYREDPDYWAKWFPADFITESFPGQFRNWFYSMLAMSTVLRREAPFKTIFGYATLFGEDGRPMHKSWGNAIEFDEAAERMGVDVMRWMYAQRAARGQHPVRLARRRRGPTRAARPLERLRVLRSTYARLAGWTPGSGGGHGAAPPPADRPPLDRWILSRAAGLAADAGARLADYDALGALARGSRRSSTTSRPGTCASRGSGSRGTTTRPTGPPRSRRSTRRSCRSPGSLAPILPFLSESMYGNLVTTVDDAAPDSVHLTRWPADELAPLRDQALEDAMATARKAVELARTLRGSAGIRVRQPLARLWIALPGGDLRERDALLEPRPRRGQRPGRRADRRRVRPRRAAGEAAPAEDRQAARGADPGGHGRRPRGRRRVQRRTAP